MHAPSDNTPYHNSLLPHWTFNLTLQQQAVLILATRGPDGFPKHHPCKPILYYYRAAILSAAHLGRHLRVGEHVNSLMTLQGFDDGVTWSRAVLDFAKVIDELPLHYLTHLMHGAQILAYRHPDELFRIRWLHFYTVCCDYLHVPLESGTDMDNRLNDFGRPIDFIAP